MGTLLWRSFLPFLVLAEPLAFFLYEGGRYCEPLCFRPTTAGVGSLALVLLGAWFSAVALTGLASRAVRPGAPWLDRFANPSRRTLALLLGLFGAYVFFLTLDAASVREAVWKPIVLPASVVLFLPVWILYVATFLIAMLMGALGVGVGPGVTLVVRGVVLFGGFGLAAVWQAVLITAVSKAAGSR